MKQTSLKKNLVWLRICITVFLVAILSLFLLSFTASGKVGSDIWQQLGLSQAQGMEKIKNSFLNNYFDYYGARNAKNIVVGNRAAIARDLLTYAKQYVSSNTFKTEYEKLRLESRPTLPTSNSRTKEDIRKELIAETEKGIKTTEEVLKTANADVKEALKGILEMHKANLKEYKNPDSQMIDLMYQGEAFNQESRQRQYQEDLKNWEINFPADYKQVIKSRLQKYLSIANTVDFSAELVEKYGKKRFVKPAYEAKNAEWKMIYRAGKEVYTVTKAFAEQWLKEL